MGVEEVAVRRLALRHETRGIKIPSLVLIEGPEPHGRKRKHDEPEGRQKPISLHRCDIIADLLPKREGKRD